MKILVINSGSTSLKYQLIDSDNEKVLIKGLYERIGQDPELPTHKEALEKTLDSLTDKETGVIGSLDEIDAVGHRVVHGGEYFSEAVRSDDDVLAKIEELCDLAPLHNPANLLGIKACMKLMPGTLNVAVFDTAFHQTMPREAYLYGIPYEYYDKYKLRKYGFHGTSHSFVSKRAIELLNENGVSGETKVIVCHLGGGASISAVLNGKSVDTSMGLTPLEGLLMGTRSGDLDPAVIQYIMNKEGLDINEMLNVLNKKSGFFGLGGSADCRDIEDGYLKGEQGCTDAFNIFCYRIAKTVGAYAAAMNGADMIAFTAGIGEHDSLIREKIMERLGFMGLEFDKERNDNGKGEFKISSDSSKVMAYVIPTNEELAIARDTVRLV